MTLVINSIILITVFTFFYANSLKSIFVNSNRLPLHTIHVLYPTAFNEYRQCQMQLRHMHKVQKSTKDKHAPIKESAARCSVGAGRFLYIPNSQQHCPQQEAQSVAIFLFRPLYIYIYIYIYLNVTVLLASDRLSTPDHRRSSRKSRILVPLGSSPQPEAAFHKRQYLFLMLSKLCGCMVLFQLPQKMFNLFRSLSRTGCK